MIETNISKTMYMGMVTQPIVIMPSRKTERPQILTMALGKNAWITLTIFAIDFTKFSYKPLGLLTSSPVANFIFA